VPAIPGEAVFSESPLDGHQERSLVEEFTTHAATAAIIDSWVMSALSETAANVVKRGSGSNHDGPGRSLAPHAQGPVRSL
jgi:hypothetical protein